MNTSFQPIEQGSQSIQAEQIAALQTVQADLPNGTRMHTVGRVIILTLAGPCLLYTSDAADDTR